MSKNHVAIAAYAIVIVIPTLLVGGAAWLVNHAYQANKALIIKEISEIGDFDETAASIKTAEELKLQYPVQPPSKSPEEIRQEIKDRVQEMLKNKFSAKNLSLAKMQINKKYEPAKHKDEVTIIAKTSKTPIKGKFYGFDGKLVQIGDVKIRFDDIEEDFRYLFDAELADKICREKLAEFDRRFQEEKKIACENLTISLENEMYPKCGYQKPDEYGGWVSNIDVFTKKLEQKRSKFEKEKTEKISDIEKRHRLFGIVDVKYK